MNLPPEVLATGSTRNDAALRWAMERLTGPVEVQPMKQRPWATTWRLQDAERVAYLKASSVRTRYEVPLMTTLARVAPSQIPAVLAAEPESGWLLLADAGATLNDQPTLNDRPNSGFDLAAWLTMLPRFGQLQRAVAPVCTELIAAGVPDERPERFGAVLAELLSGSTQLGGLTSGERQALDGIGSRSQAALDELAELGIPASIQHGDLHGGNVSVGVSVGTGSGEPRFFDFGDGSLAHPFTTLLVPLRVARSQGADEAQLQRMRDSYLEVFSDLATGSQLRHALDLTLRTGAVLKATAWDRALTTAPARHEWGEPVVEWLRELL